MPHDVRIRMILIPVLALSVLAAPAAGPADTEAQEPKSIADITDDLERFDGLLTFHLDRDEGKVWLELPETPATFLYVPGLRSGLGSNPVGLDRSALGRARVVDFRRVGNRLLVEQQNLDYRALSEHEAEVDSVRRSFATSVLWAGPVAARSENRYLVDFTPFLVRDAFGVTARLEWAKQGAYSLDPERSVFDPASALAFPDNLEFESVLTFQATGQPGSHVRETAPSARTVTLVLHHSLIRLPDDGYRPREFDPRIGPMTVRFQDYAAGLDEPLVRRWVVRHRLEKTDPAAERSPVREPIVYYIDRGAPEPIRAALVEGASWWAEAFEKAGFLDAFRVEILPEGVHPLDVRYNVVHWVHRSTRGWSFGGGIVDPRTGELIKANVLLGSLRVRQDRMLFEGLFGTANTGTGRPDDPVELALARIRQLSAHEVGHTLGLNHNYAASTYDGRASVMDYPAPLIRVGDGGGLDASDAYGVGVGSWDAHTIRWLYSEFPPGTDEAAALDGIVRDGLDRGLIFLSDADARPAGAAHPLASLWDNGADPVAALEESLEVRRIALSRFGEGNIAEGQPLATLRDVLVPLYLHHRYQLTAASKVIGGVDYAYTLRGDGQGGASPVDPAWQRRAIAAILGILSPERLDLPDSLVDLLLPPPPGYYEDRERFESGAAPAFDPVVVAATAADGVFDAVLQGHRAERMVQQNARDEAYPGFTELLAGLVETVFAEAGSETARQVEIRRALQGLLVRRLIAFSADPDTSAAVRSRVDGALGRLAGGLGDTDHERMLAGEIRRYLERSRNDTPRPAEGPATPPGDPIGSAPGYLAGCSRG